MSTHNVSHGILSACLGGRCPYFFLFRLVHWQASQREQTCCTVLHRVFQVKCCFIVSSVLVSPGWPNTSW